MKGWKSSHLLKKPLPNKQALEQIDREQKARIAQTAEQERQEFIAFVKQHTGIELIAEYAFHPEKKYRMDFANLDLKLSIEIDGGIYMEKSGHNSITGILTSMKKRNEAQVMGWRCLHITVQEKDSQYIIDLLKRFLAA
jgi:very-short-patch-repair endonuclease